MRLRFNKILDQSVEGMGWSFTSVGRPRSDIFPCAVSCHVGEIEMSEFLRFVLCTISEALEVVWALAICLTIGKYVYKKEYKKVSFLKHGVLLCNIPFIVPLFVNLAYMATPGTSPRWCRHDNTLVHEVSPPKDYKSVMCIMGAKLMTAAFALFTFCFMATLQFWWWTMCDVAAGRSVNFRPSLHFFVKNCKDDVLGASLFFGYSLATFFYIFVSFPAPVYDGNPLTGGCTRDSARAQVMGAYGSSPIISIPAFVLFAWIFYKLRCLMKALRRLGGGGRTRSRKRYVQKLLKVEHRLKLYCLFYACFILACLPFQPSGKNDQTKRENSLDQRLQCHLLSSLSPKPCQPLFFWHMSWILAWLSKQLLTSIFLVLLYSVSIDDFSL